MAVARSRIDASIAAVFHRPVQPVIVAPARSRRRGRDDIDYSEQCKDLTQLAAERFATNDQPAGRSDDDERRNAQDRHAIAGAERLVFRRLCDRGRHSGTAGDARHITAARERDHDLVVRAGACVIAIDRAPQPRRLDAHDRIDLRIEAGVAAQHLDADRVALQPPAFPA
jgi:hypothetical protein